MFLLIKLTQPQGYKYGMNGWSCNRSWI